MSVGTLEYLTGFQNGQKINEERKTGRRREREREREKHCAPSACENLEMD